MRAPSVRELLEIALYGAHNTLSVLFVTLEIISNVMNLIVHRGRKDPSVQLRDTSMDLTQWTTCVPRICVAYRNYEEPACTRRNAQDFLNTPLSEGVREYAVVKVTAYLRENWMKKSAFPRQSLTM